MIKEKNLQQILEDITDITDITDIQISSFPETNTWKRNKAPGCMVVFKQLIFFCLK